MELWTVTACPSRPSTPAVASGQGRTEWFKDDLVAAGLPRLRADRLAGILVDAEAPSEEGLVHCSCLKKLVNAAKQLRWNVFTATIEC